jgi:hypothetical protein
MDAEPHLRPVRPLAAFAVPNFRRFVTGQTISLVGSWTETVAQAILALQLTHSVVGSTPIGATIIGAIGDTSPRLALAVGSA